MLDDVHARGGMHRRRLNKRGYNPATLYTNFDTPTDAPTDTAGSAATPTPVPSSDPVQQPTPTPTPAQPSSSSAAPAAAQTSQSSANPAPVAQSSSSSSSASAASTPSSSSSSAPTPAATPKAAETQQPAGLGPSVPVVTVTNSQGATFHSLSSLNLPATGTAAPASSGTPGTDTTSSVKAPVVIGIVVAVIAGLAAIIFAVTYFMRRSRNDDSDEAFRRQSMVLPDDPPMRNGGGGRPDSMMDSVPGGAPVSFGAHGSYDQSYHGYGNGHEGSFAPGQVMPASAWSPVNTPHTTQPFFQPMGQSPLASPVQYDSAYNNEGQLVRQQSMGAGAYLDRQPSNGAMLNRQPSYGPEAAFARQHPYSAEATLARQPSNGAQVIFDHQAGYGPGSPYEPSAPSPVVTRQPSAAMHMDSPSDAHYVDLNRSSVSPFQAAQYAEISNRLQTEPPAPLPTPLRVAAADEVIAQEGAVQPTVRDPRPLNVTSPVMERASPFADPHGYERGTFGEQDFPRPPSPTYSSKSSRVDSSPPKLPEITVQQRAFSPTSMDFPLTPSIRPSPSPLATSFDIPTPPIEAHFGNAQGNVPRGNETAAGAPAAAPRTTNAGPAAPRPDTVYTLYDDDDAYAGI